MRASVFIDAVLARTDEEKAEQNQAKFHRGKVRAQGSTSNRAEQMHERDRENKQNPGPKKQPEDHERPADTTKERADKSPGLEMIVQAEILNAASETRPA